MTWHTVGNIALSGQPHHQACMCGLQLVTADVSECWHDYASQLFSRLINDTNHVLRRLLPPPTTASQHYNLRPRRHTLQLPEHHTRLLDSNFFDRMLYKHYYQHTEKLCGFYSQNVTVLTAPSQLHSFFITCYTFLISILCTTLRMSVFNKELLTYLIHSIV